MNNFKYILLFCLILFPISSKSYGLTNSWCSNGKYSKAISPFPKPQFNKCPGYAKIIMTKKEVTDYYLNGLGKDYLCKLTSNPLFFVGSKHKREDYEALKLLFKPNQVKVAVMCAQLNRTKLAKKKAEEAKQTARVNVNKGPKEWCLPQNKYQRNIPFHKLEDGNKCPSNTEEISKEKALDLILTKYDGYLNQIIVSGTICDDTYKNYKYLREMIREEKNLDCNKIKAELLKKNQEKKQKAIDQKKAEEEAKIKALAEKLAKEEIAKQLRKKELAKKKENQTSSQNKLSKTKEEALFVVKVLKEYVKTDNDLDILEIGDLLNNYTTQVNKGWSDKTISSYDKLFKYASSDKNFIKYLDKKKTEQKQKYEREVLQLKNELKSSQKLLSNYIKKNLGTDEANSALELAKKAKSILKKFNYKEAIQLKVKISKWRSKNGFTKNNKKEKTKIKRVVSKTPNVSNIKKEKGKYPEFLKDKYWFKSKSVNGYSYKNGVNCKKIVKDMKNDWLTFFNFNESNIISYSRSNEELDGFRFSIRAYEKNRNFIFGYSIKNGNGYKKNIGYTRYTDTEVPDEIIIHENFNTGSLKRIMLYNQKHQILVGKKIIQTIDKDIEKDTFKVRFNWCSGQPPKAKLALSDEQALEKLRKNDKVRPKNNKNRSQIPCAPYGSKEDTFLNNLMAKKHKGKCMHATYGEMYYENQTRKMEQQIICHYSNGVKLTISAPLYYSSACSRYIN